MAAPPAALPVAKPQSLHCPNCGGVIERRGFGYTLTMACPSCAAVIDASTPLFSVVQTVENALSKHQPLIPLGTRGNLDNATWEAIGFQVRGITVDGDHFSWDEYLLFNPYRGFRYLTFYEGHWNFVKPLESIPEGSAAGSAKRIHNRIYKHFASAEAVTEFVIGEFPWQVRVGERVRTADYVNPPYVLSQEGTRSETTWSEGVYVTGREIWKAFSLQGSAPWARGVYLNQPSPYKSPGSLWVQAFLMILVTLVLMLGFAIVSRPEIVREVDRTFASTSTGEPSFVTAPFTLSGRPATVEVETDTDLNNNWADFGYTLINDDTGEAYDFGREVSYYHGADSDGPWTEGSASDSVILPAVPPGRYYLRVEPDMESTTPMRFHIRVRHDVPTYTWFLIVMALLLIPPLYRTIKYASFERMRWAESDHPPVSTSSGDDD